MDVNIESKESKGILGTISGFLFEIIGLIANSESTLQRIRQLSEDWVYLALLGTIMSLLALLMDFITENMSKCRNFF